jgi:hypothetical protein
VIGCPEEPSLCRTSQPGSPKPGSPHAKGLDWLSVRSEAGYVETVNGCLFVQSPSAFFTCLLPTAAPRQPSPAETADSHVPPEPGCGDEFARREPGPMTEASNQTGATCMPRAWFDLLQATNHPLSQNLLEPLACIYELKKCIILLLKIVLDESGSVILLLSV